MSRSRRARATSGSRVGGGRLRVDAARAVHKLRDYQLADPAMWALEAVRAAATAGASAVHVDGDADDVWVGWQGAPVSRDELPRLLDELVSPVASDERRTLQLLATAINTALGLGPRWVDVYALDDAGASCVRYTPSLLAPSAEGAAEGLRALAARDATLPAGAPPITQGVIVHLRRFPALEALSLLATGQEARELRYVRRACEDFPLPLRIARGELTLHHAAGDLLRVRLDPRVLGEGRQGFLALVDPSVARADAWLDFAELGVVLATEPLDLGIPFQSGARVPVRARVDTPRLPTNASRSAVRRDERWLEELAKHCVALFGELVSRVARELGEAPEGSWSPARRARLRAASIQLAAAWCGGPDWRTAARGAPLGLPPALAPLFDAPLARDAIGRHRSIRELARGEAQLAHVGPEPLTADLEPWLGDLPWVPAGDPLAHLWGGHPIGSARALVEAARSHRDARARWLAKEATEPVVATRASHLVVAPLAAPGKSARSCVPASLFARPGIAGEVAIDPGGSHAHVELLVEGRRSESSRLAATLGLDAVATASDLRLAPDHSCVTLDEARSALLLAIDGAVVVACESVARRLAGQEPPKGDPVRWLDRGAPLDREVAARVVRAGIARALELRQRTALLESRSPLLDAPAWPTVRGEMRSLAELAALAGERGRAIGYVLTTRGASWQPEERDVLVLEARERDLLAHLLPTLELVDYEGVARAPDAAQLARLARHRCVVALELRERAYRGAIGWLDPTFAQESEIELSHGGRVLRGPPTPPRAPGPHYLLRIDDDRVVPGGDGAARFVPEVAPYTDVEPALCRLVVALAEAMLGRDTPGLHAPRLHPAPEPAALAVFFEACRDLRPSAANVLGRERVQALRSAPLLPRLFSTERASVDALAAEHGGELVYVPPAALALAGGPVPGYHPLLASEAVAEGVARVFQLRTRNGTTELADRQHALRRTARLTEHRARRVRGLTLPASVQPVVRVSGQGLRGLLGLDRSGPARTEVEVLVEERAFERRAEPLPHLVAVVDVDEGLVVGALESLGATAESRLRGALRESACELAARIAGTRTTPLEHDEAALAFVRAWLHATRDGKRRAAVERAMLSLREAPIFATVQGGLASIADCTRKRRTVRVCAPVERWLGPVEGDPPDTLDQPVLVEPSPESVIGEIIRALAPGLVRDVSANVRRLQAKRRVRWGLVARPALGSARDARFRWTLEDLAAVAVPSERKAFDQLGIGELALSGRGESRVAVFEAGVQLRHVALDLRPGVELACEPSVTMDRAELEQATRVVLARAIRHLVETTPEGTLPAWLRQALRESALLGGRSHLESLAELPMFETTAGRWASFRDLEAQVARFAKLWITSKPQQSLEPLDPERVAVRAPDGEAARLGAVLATQDADEELRLDAIARANRARPALESFGPTDAHRALALGEESVDAGGAHGVVLALHPAHAARRGLQAARDRHPLGTVEDPSSWPALAWVDQPRFTPDRTWSAPARDVVLTETGQAVRDACERALGALAEAPTTALAWTRVDRAFSSQALSGRSAQVRGVLWIDPAGEPTVEVIDADGAEERVLTMSRGVTRDAPLPLAGRLVIVGVAGTGARSALQSVAAHAYERMLREISRRVTEGERRDPVELDLDLAELVRGAGLSLVQEGHPGASIALSFLGSEPATLLGLARALSAREPGLIVPPDRREHARELAWKGAIVIDDGSLAARRAIVALGARAVRFEDALADRVREAPTPVAEVRPQPAQLPASSAAAPAERKRAKSKRERTAAAEKPAARAVSDAAERALAERTDALIRGAGAARGRIPSVVVSPLRETPLALPRPDGRVELAGGHPLAPALTRAGDHPEALAILAAHVLGAAARSDDDAYVAEGHAILALLTKRS